MNPWDPGGDVLRPTAATSDQGLADAVGMILKRNGAGFRHPAPSTQPMRDPGGHAYKHEEFHMLRFIEQRSPRVHRRVDEVARAGPG